MKIKIVERKKKKNCLSHENYKTWDGKEDCLVSQGYSREVAKKILGAAKAKGQIDEAAYSMPLSESELKDRFIALFNISGIHIDKIPDIFMNALNEYMAQNEPFPYGTGNSQLSEKKNNQ